MRHTVRIATLLGLVSLHACKGDRSFRTNATYEGSAYRMIAFAEGIVPPGEDVADVPAHVLLCPRSTGRAVMIDVPSGTSRVASYAIEGAAAGTMSWDRKRSAAELARVLADAGYSVGSPEVDETIDVIGGVSAGPKGTRMHGQTRMLVVKVVDFHTAKRPPAFTDCR